MSPEDTDSSGENGGSLDNLPDSSSAAADAQRKASPPVPLACWEQPSSTKFTCGAASSRTFTASSRGTGGTGAQEGKGALGFYGFQGPGGTRGPWGPRILGGGLGCWGGYSPQAAEHIHESTDQSDHLPVTPMVDVYVFLCTPSWVVVSAPSPLLHQPELLLVGCLEVLIPPGSTQVTMRSAESTESNQNTECVRVCVWVFKGVVCMYMCVCVRIVVWGWKTLVKCYK